MPLTCSQNVPQHIQYNKRVELLNVSRSFCPFISYVGTFRVCFTVQWHYLLLSVTKCRKNLSLTKNRLTNADDSVDFSETAISSCDNDQQFDDGTNRENIKCTTTRERVGVWSHQEQSCHGTASDSALSHTVVLLIIN